MSFKLNNMEKIIISLDGNCVDIRIYTRSNERAQCHSLLFTPLYYENNELFGALLSKIE